ncbi:hypothetical protein BGW38_010317 [Lunasporangiospora selenospora]|uniref:Methyltransferase domain-containing protein n=1 Tax=Lunasporangiospora selenospora TaxID=979761 RepID=A0A9P6FYM3_9FUNG|nr:hypothetical protein BGW38_010317 [Lunasporangiospora selenospora]
MSDYQTLNNDHFNATADKYDNIPSAAELTAKGSQTILREFRASTSDENVKNATVLDFGCGTGLSAHIVAKEVKYLVGLDASEGMLKQFNEKVNTNPEHADIKSKVQTIEHLVTNESPLPEPERTQFSEGFDLVYSSYVMHHIDDVDGVVKAIANNLVKEKTGWFIVLDFSGSHGHGHAHAHGHGHGHGHAHAHGHGHGHGHAHAHAHGHSHGHSHGGSNCKNKEQAQGEQEKKGDDEQNLEIPAFVAHDGFSRARLEEVFRNAGLVDVSSDIAFKVDNHVHVWKEAILVKGRRP